MEEKINLFVTCAQDLELILEDELRALGYPSIKPGFRGVYVDDVSMEAVYRINYLSRIAGRVLLPLSRFRCYNRETLYKSARAIDWMAYIPKGKTFAIDANVTHHRFNNSLFAAQVVKDAICDQIRDATGQRPNVRPTNPDVQLNLYIRDETGVISLDTSGTALHKRGYRIEAVEAPMQESLAAALLMIAGYKSDAIFCDPCCGSGTLLIEAALMASNTPPGYLRQKWGFMLMPQFSQALWLKVKAEADKERKGLLAGHFFGCDINRDAVRITKTNLRAAGFHSSVEIVHSDFKEYTPPVPPDFVITNPPHGRRLDETDVLRPLYRALGDFLKRKTATPGRAFVFTGNLELAKEVGLAPKRRHVLTNSGVESRFLEFDLF